MIEFVIKWERRKTAATIIAPARSNLKCRMIKLSMDYPGECDYLERVDGSVIAHVPKQWLRGLKIDEIGKEATGARGDMRT